MPPGMSADKKKFDGLALHRSNVYPSIGFIALVKSKHCRQSSHAFPREDWPAIRFLTLDTECGWAIALRASATHSVSSSHANNALWLRKLQDEGI
jgi:hypothetical protein